MRRSGYPYLMVVALILAGCSGPEPESAAPESFDAASNRGQAYVVDENSDPNILVVAANSPDHSTLVAAVRAAELENVLVNAGPLTVFAPTDAAFAALPEGTLDELLKPENKGALARIVTSHAAPGKYTPQLLRNEERLYQATGHYVDVEVRGEDIYVNGARILATVEASNGVVHVVDQVFLVAAG